MTLLMKIRHRIGKWLWKENGWTKAVDDIEKGARELKQSGDCKVIVLRWQFKFLEKPNKFIVTIKLEDWKNDKLS